jgi:mono/diheme cytochrome c family protein
MPAALGGHNGYNRALGFQAFKGDIAEMVAVKGTVTDAEFQSIEAYLMSKYALP